MVGLVTALVAMGCVRKPYAPQPCERADLSGCVIEQVDVRNNTQVASDDIKERIATAESTHVLGGALEHVPVLGVLDRLSIEYERFDPFVLERDLTRIERYYRSRGFYEAHVRAGRVMRRPDGTVRVEIVVDEGPPVGVGQVDLAWKDWRAEPEHGRWILDATAAITDIVNDFRAEKRFDEDAYEATKQKLLRAMTDRGFAYATVDGHADIDLVQHKAHIVFTLELGPYCTFGDVTLVGLGEIPEGPVRREVRITKGRRYSTETLQEAEYSLAGLGVFGNIDIRPQLSAAGEPRRTEIPVVITVQPTELRAVRGGPGAQVGGRVEGHLVVGWEDRNFLGGLRTFSTELRAGLVFFPLRIDRLVVPVKEISLLPELRARFELKQPTFWRTNAILRGAFNLYQLTQPGGQPVFDNPDDAAKYNIVGYREYVGMFGFERWFGRQQHYIMPSINVQLDDPFSYNQATPPDGYERVFIPYLEAFAFLDFRRGATGKLDRIHPHKGVYVGMDTQLAVGPKSWDGASDVRIRPEVRAYAPISKRVTLAVRGMTGLLFPSNYDSTIDQTPPPSTATAGTRAAYERLLARDLQILQFRGFFSGGPNSNRGYPYNAVGPHAVVTYLSQAANLNQDVPTGGRGVWESSAEVRVPLSEMFATVVFVDASDVMRTLRNFCPLRPHLSTGFGLRYDTPVGPLRGDIGYRIPGLQVIDGGCPNQQDDNVPDTILGVPIAVSIALGEAF